MVLVVIVVVLWIVILVPSMRRRSRTGNEIGSISHFHRQLRVLEQSGPQPIVAPAYRLRAAGGNGDSRVLSSGSDTPPVLTVVGADQLPRPALAFLGDDPSPRPDPSPGADPCLEGSDPAVAHRLPMVEAGDLWAEDPGGWDSTGGAAPARVADPVTRQLVRRRRRDILGLLFAAVVVTTIIGFIPGAAPVFMATAVLAVALVAYVALLVQLRRRAEEREEKLRYLAPGSARRYPTRMSGRYAHPSNQAAASR